MESSIQIDYRCACGKLLFRGLIFRSFMEAKCPRCNKLNCFQGICTRDNPYRFTVLATLKGKMIKVSGSVESALGYAPEMLLGRNITELFSGEETRESDRLFIQKLVGKKYLRLDGWCRDKHAKAVPVSISYQHLTHSGGELFLRIIDVIPEIDKKLIDEAKFDPINFCHVVSETDERGMILYVDHNIEVLTGFKPADLVGRYVDELLFGEEKNWRSKNYAMLRAKKKAYRTLPGYKIKGKSGEVFEQEVYCTPFYDDVGNFIGFRNMHWLRKSVEQREK